MVKVASLVGVGHRMAMTTATTTILTMSKMLIAQTMTCDGEAKVNSTI